MTKKDYIKIASILSKYHPDLFFNEFAREAKHPQYILAMDNFRNLIHDLADYFGEENNLFDRIKFAKKVFSNKEW